MGPAAPVFNGEREGDIYYYHSDALGSVYQMTDGDEVVVRSYDYSAFGAIISESGTLENPFTYTARERDEESGLYYYRFRHYDPEIGRFISRDPIFTFGFISADSPDIRKSWYCYALNEPVKKLDAFGLFSFWGCLWCHVQCGLLYTALAALCDAEYMYDQLLCLKKPFPLVVICTHDAIEKWIDCCDKALTARELCHAECDKSPECQPC